MFRYSKEAKLIFGIKDKIVVIWVEKSPEIWLTNIQIIITDVLLAALKSIPNNILWGTYGIIIIF